MNIQLIYYEYFSLNINQKLNYIALSMKILYPTPSQPHLRNKTEDKPTTFVVKNYKVQLRKFCFMQQNLKIKFLLKKLDVK